MKPALLTLALLVVPPAAGAAGGHVDAGHWRAPGPVKAPPRAVVVRLHPSTCSTVHACRKAIQWQKANRRHLRHLLTVRFRRDASFAIDLAARAYNVSAAKMYQVASCESTGGHGLNPFAYNRSSGATGLFQWLPSSWATTPFSVFSPYDPIASAIATGWRVSREGGWGGWVCG